MHYACSKNRMAIARLLVENGAELNLQDKYGATPLHRAASQGHENVRGL
jgi:26S proteasome non-ATPase regulatory subunit 10